MSAANNSRNPRVVFIGSIPFEVTEEQLIDIFKEVGPVLSFRLMFDRETGRSRGYAFCEYADSETAASAIRNLTGYEIGGRHLKVDKADNDMLPSAAGGGSVFGSNTGSSSVRDQRDQSTHMPSARPIQNLPGVAPSSSTTAIHSILSVPPFTNPQNLLELLTSLKGTIQNNPDQARHLLSGNPALSYALLQSFISLGLIDMSTVQSLLVQSQQTLQSSQQQAQVSPAAAPVSSAEQQKALIMQIMNMTPEQINLLPAQQRDQVLQLKQQILLQQQKQN